jgi:hypothetical protein
MGKLEDWMVYTKLILLAVILGVLITQSQTTLPVLLESAPSTNLFATVRTQRALETCREHRDRRTMKVLRSRHSL